MTARQLVGKLHLWLGLASGLVVFIVSLTGAIFVFQDDIRDLLDPWRRVPVQATAMALPSQLQAAALAAHPGQATPADTWVTYFGPARSATVFFTDKAANPMQVYLNPYTGRVLHEENLHNNFFSIVQEIHMTLLLPEPYAKWVVGGGVIIFVVLLGTGLVLWWPKRRQERKQRFAVKWGARWRRVNYDLHNVLGFYAASIALVLALTGLVMIFPGMLASVQRAVDGGQAAPPEIMTTRLDTLRTVPAARQPLPDVIYRTARRLSPTHEMILLGPTGAGKTPAFCWTYQKALHYYHRNEFAFHPVSGQLLESRLHATKSRGTRLSDMNYDLHVGQILGLGGKLVAFLASLISASLPITGVIIWWGRRHKSRQPRRPARMAVS